MSIVQRIQRLVRADMHAVMDLVEDPQATLTQALRDMREAIDKKKAKAAELEKEQRRGAKSIERLEARLEELDDEVDTSFAADNPALARTFIRRRLETRAAIECWRDRQTSLDETLAAVLEEVDRCQSEYDRIEAQAAVCNVRETAEPAESRGRRVTDEEVEAAFIREAQKRKSS